MSRELLRNHNGAGGARWMARILGASVLTPALIIPSTHAVETATQPFNPGPKLEAIEPQVVQPPIAEPAPPPPINQGRLTRDTGVDMPACDTYKICGTDLLIPFQLLPDKDGKVKTAYATGDTFAVAGPYIQDLPPGGDMWRSPTILISPDMPEPGKPINFTDAANVDQNGVAQEVMYDSHRQNGHEVTIFPNSAIAIPETGEIIMSYQSVSSEITPKQANWATGYTGLAVSTDNGQHFTRLLSGPNGEPGPGDPVWMNDAENDDVFQMWGMQRDGDYVYINTVKAGRQSGPMMMLRVPVKQITDKGAYECWNGNGWGGDCKPILPDSKYGEPSIMKMDDGTPEGLWVMSYVDYTYTQLVTSYAKSPTGPWSEPKVQLDWTKFNAMYGGFPVPGSTPDHLELMVSTWQREIDEKKYGKYGKLLQYGVSHLSTTLY